MKVNGDSARVKLSPCDNYQLIIKYAENHMRGFIMSPAKCCSAYCKIDQLRGFKLDGGISMSVFGVDICDVTCGGETTRIVA